ncbi:GNAT family N-acetyltransferase [Nocardioides sp. SYSU DS0663]|uniref:GNAT family N-acetyltransferase n=1 Tax=Nocardioides sp. SYSU DS0663 TaxID=3416445 RepID=UPI003F4C8843
MSTAIDLPAGLSSRPLTLDDAQPVVDVMAAQELEDVGEVVIELGDIVGDWQRPSFDIAASTLGVFDGDRLVAYGEHSGGDRSDAAVHPAYRGRGIGTALAGWIRETARGRGATVVGQPVPQGSAGDRLLEALGYQVRWTSWVLQLPPGRTVPERPLPAGHVVREARDDERRAVWTVVEDAFLEWSDRERESFEDFSASTFQRPGFEPWHVRVVADASGEVLAAALLHLDDGCGFVDKLATRADQRGRGLAQALLVDAFAAARAHGATRSELSTDSRTGALALYEKVGMVVTSTWLNRAATL